VTRLLLAVVAGLLWASHVLAQPSATDVTIPLTVKWHDKVEAFLHEIGVLPRR
jgi:hypothetical protein